MGSLLVLIIFVALFLYQNQTETATETVESITSGIGALNTDLRLMQIYELDYSIRNEENIRLIEAITYGCRYGKGEGKNGFNFKVSNSSSLTFHPVNYTSNYLNRTIGTNYYLKVDCNPIKADSKVFEVGRKPPEESSVIAKSMAVPLPYSNITNAVLYRWY